MSSAAPLTDARSRRDLAVEWMNRGHASLLAGDRTELASALESYRCAIVLLRPCLAASDAEPSWTNTLGAALMNHGELLHRLHGLDRADAALADFTEAEQLLAALPPAADSWAPRNLAGTLINRANLLLDLQRRTDAADAARRALTLVEPAERRDPIDAELALKARRAHCDALGRLLVDAGDAADALAATATDVVDDAIALVHHWHARQVEFRELALRFFYFGAQLYRIYQPHFLAEFLRENLPAGDAEFRTVGCDIVRQALADRIVSQPFFTLGDADSERRLHTARELRALLAEISGPDAATGRSA